MDSNQFDTWLKTCPYPTKTIGKSVCGQKIYAIFAEFNAALPWCIITAGMHAREHLSTDVVTMLIDKLKYQTNPNCNLCFVPLVNPDGADIANGKLAKFNKKTQKNLLKINKSSDFSLYKANARGVDINNNWNANWHNQFTKHHAPSPQGYYGKRPLSEKETKALYKLTKKFKLILSLSFHLKGEEIYFDFFQDPMRFERDKKIAQIFANATGYKIVSTQETSSGGFKDWCVQTLKIPALTIELGADSFSHPYPKSQLKNIIKKNLQTFESIFQAVQVLNEYQNIH